MSALSEQAREEVRELFHSWAEEAGLLKPPAEAPRLEDLWTVQQARAFLKISRSKIYRMIESGELPTVPVGKRGLRVDPEILRQMKSAE